MTRHAFGAISKGRNGASFHFFRECSRCGARLKAVTSEALDRPPEKLRFAQSSRLSNDCDVELARSIMES